MTDGTGDSPDDAIASERAERLAAILGVELEIQAVLKSIIAPPETGP